MLRIVYSGKVPVRMLTFGALVSFVIKGLTFGTFQVNIVERETDND
ncbi:hypothetical protein [Paenibacillus kribbensis]|nr:hypothetical protein [Paenibacillus kribbensis]